MEDGVSSPGFPPAHRRQNVHHQGTSLSLEAQTQWMGRPLRWRWERRGNTWALPGPLLGSA